MFTVQVLDLLDGHDAEVCMPTLQKAYDWLWKHIRCVSLGTVLIYEDGDDEPTLRMPIEDGRLVATEE